MGSLGLNSNLPATYQRDIYAKGLDLNGATVFDKEFSYPVAPGTTIRPGQWLKLDTVNEGCVTPCTAVTDKPFGCAKWSKQSRFIAMAVDMPVVVVAGAVVTLTGYANIQTLAGVGEFSMYTEVEGGGTELDGPTGYGAGGSTDYTAISLTNGTVTFDATPANVADGDTVYATFAYEMSNAQMNTDGHDFHNQAADDVTLGGDGVVVGQGWSDIYTTEFEPNVTTWYAIGSSVYLSANGRVTTESGGSAVLIGVVTRLPVADYKFLGYQTRGGPF